MKRLFSIILAAVMISGMLAVFSVSAAADSDSESLSVKKIVSVVYDDSGSMKGEDKSVYASYAMQAFCSMLNSQDELYITFMNENMDDNDNSDTCNDLENFEPKKIDLSDNNFQSTINSLSKPAHGGGFTPYGAIIKAFEKLTQVDCEDKNAQYWLVVITDGAFTNWDYSGENITEEFKKYSATEMPNGSKPYITFLGIGSDVVAPNEELTNVHIYKASSAKAITDTMSKMAEKVSGRTNIKVSQGTANSVKVSSNVPVSNFAVFAQNTSAKVTKVTYGKNKEIKPNRKVSLGVDGYDLNATACIIGNSKDIIEDGTYEIHFDGAIKAENVQVMFEPAVELVVSVENNGKTVEFHNNTEFVNYFTDAVKGEEYTIVCKICEVGNSKNVFKVDQFNSADVNISVTETGSSAQTNDKDEQKLTFKLSDTPVETTISVSGTVDGFNLQNYFVKFTPQPKIEIKASFEENCSGGFNFADIKTDKNNRMIFTVYEDDKEITDAEKVKKYDPKLEIENPEENKGSWKYEGGKIVYTITEVPERDDDKGYFTVKVTCTLNNGKKASEVYTVRLAHFIGHVNGTDDELKKTEFFNNDIGVSFYITKHKDENDKNGVRLTKSALGSEATVEAYVLFNDEYIAIRDRSVVLEDDGLIKVTPNVAEDHPLTFWNWWINWAYYFGLEGSDVKVTLNHPLLDSPMETTINVVGEDMSYMLLNVYAPLIIEIILLALLIIWIFLIVTKPRYNKGSTLYVGEIRYNKTSGTRTVRNFSPVKLEKFNKVKRGNGRLKFKAKADVVSANGLKIRADRGGRICCEMMFPWYRGKLEVADSDFENLKTPADVSEYISKHKRLEINEFATTEAIDNDFDRGIAPASARMAKYTVIPDSGAVKVVDGKKVINSGKIFIYVNS